MNTYIQSRLMSTVSRLRSLVRPGLFALALALPLAACSSTPSAPPGLPQPKASLESEDPALVLWPVEEKAVRLQFKSDRDLNLYDSRPHSIQVCVYQLDDKKAFLEHSKTPEGIATLLKAEAFDTSVKDVTRLFIQPLEDAVYELDRAENARFVGIVSGYFDSNSANSAKLWPIELKKTRIGSLFWASTIYSAGTLELSLRLTAKAMTGTVIPPKEQ